MAHCARPECGRWRPDVLARHGRMGCRLDGAWYCSPACLELAAHRRLRQVRRAPAGGPVPLPPLKLGVLLLHQGAVQPGQLASALGEQQRSGLRLGAQLQRLGLVQTADVLRALAAQDGVKYLTAIDVTRLHQSPGDLSRESVRALGLVPFESQPDEQLLKVACAAPLPRLAIAALRELTGWSVEPYLVCDELLETLVAEYGRRQKPVAEPALMAAPRGLAEAAGRVATMAKASKSVWMSQVRCDPYLWVRLQGPARTEDLLVPVDEQEEEDTCLALPMSR